MTVACPAWQRTYCVSCAGIAAYVTTYVGVDFAHVPRLYYLPLAREFHWLAYAPGVVSSYAGHWATAAAVAAIVTAIASAVLHARQRPFSARVLDLTTVLTVTVTLFGLMYLLWTNWPWHS